MDTANANRKQIGKCLERPSFFTKLPYLIYGIPTQFRHAMRFMSRPAFKIPSSLISHISVILGFRANPKMRWIYALPIVSIWTIVKHAKMVRYWSKMENPTDPVGGYMSIDRIPSSDHSISVSADAACPQPAAIGELNFAKESPRESCGKSLRKKEFFSYVRLRSIHTVLRQLRAGYWPAPGHLLFLAILLHTSTLFSSEWFVDLSVPSGGNGKSWATAWKDSTNIVWASVQPGDTIWYSGGTTGQHYYSLTLGKSGTKSNPITIRCSQDDGRNGPVDMRNLSIRGRQWITVNGAKDDAFVVPKSVTDLRHITNNIGFRIFDGTTGVTTGSGNPCVGIRLLWLEVSYAGDPEAGNSCGILLSQPSKLASTEIAYCWIHHNAIDGINNNGATTEGWDSLTIHHCVIEYNVDDGVQVGCDGVTLHHNIIGQKWRGFSTGHPDMIQQTFVSKGRLHAYNNILYNTWNAWVYNTLGAVENGTVGDVYFYGNLCYMERDPIYQTVMNYGVHLGVWGNSKQINLTTQTNVYFFNNTVYNCPDEGVLAAFNSDDKAGHQLWRMVVTNTGVINNLLVDVTHNPGYQGAGLRVNGPGNSTTSTNGCFYTTNEVKMHNNVVAGPNKRFGYGVVGKGSTHQNAEAMFLATGFTNWNDMPTFQGAGTNDYDFRLAKEDTAARDRGMDLSSFITSHGMVGLATDLYGNPRGDGPWDVGANEFVGGVDPVNPPEILGQTVMITVTATGDALAYQWSKDGVHLETQTTQTLTISPFRLSDSGTYNVNVSNSAGEVTSQSIVVCFPESLKVCVDPQEEQ